MKSTIIVWYSRSKERQKLTIPPLKINVLGFSLLLYRMGILCPMAFFCSIINS